MSEQIIKNQIFEYDGTNPFHIFNILGNESIDETLLLNHWHTELEITYVFHGCSTHYIDGNCIKANAKHLVIVNSESVHNIIPDKAYKDFEGVIAVVVVISDKYLKELIPDFESMYFVCPEIHDNDEILGLMKKISDYALTYMSESTQKNRITLKEEYNNYWEELYIKGLTDLLLAYICKNALEIKNQIMPINYQKNIERLRGVLSYIQSHYMERIMQAEVAKKFYFSSEYFSRFFKKCIGLNFVEYLTRYRIIQARQELLYSDKNILQIALDNGFSDSRRFIIAFKKLYKKTPLQYRKEYKKRKSK